MPVGSGPRGRTMRSTCFTPTFFALIVALSACGRSHPARGQHAQNDADASDGGDDDTGGGGGGGGGGSGPPMDGLFTASVTDLVIEVDYQTGAAPYTGSVVV